MLCPRQNATERRRAEVLKQLNKLGGPAACQKLLNEHRMLGTNMQSGWVNQQKVQYLAQYPAFTAQLNSLFPGAVSLGELVADLTADIANYEFTPGDAIPMISVCRDEITRPLVDAVEALWGNSFNLGSIAAMIFTGTTGLGAGMHHAPDIDEVERFLFIVAPHIAISDAGVVGKVWRPGVPTISSACGSLIGFLGEMNSGTVNFQLNTTDLEQSMMKGQMSTHFQYGTIPALQDLTKDAQVLILSQLTAALATFNLVGTAEYIVVSGVQIHGPNAANFFWPTNYYLVDLTGKTNQLNIGVFGQGGGASFLPQLNTF